MKSKKESNKNVPTKTGVRSNIGKQEAQGRTHRFPTHCARILLSVVRICNKVKETFDLNFSKCLIVPYDTEFIDIIVRYAFMYIVPHKYTPLEEMANVTDPSTQSIHGIHAQHLIEKIMRNRIYSSLYWKEECFGLTCETLVDKAIALDHFGGTFGGNQKPTPFLCLLLKMLQLQPDLEVVQEFIQNEEYKYVESKSLPLVLTRC